MFFLSPYYITVGTNSPENLNGGIKIGIMGNAPSGSPYATKDNSDFWLRAPGDTEATVQVAVPGHYLNSYVVFQFANLLMPAFNLDLTHVLFASTAQAATSGVSLGDTMTFRFWIDVNRQL